MRFWLQTQAVWSDKCQSWNFCLYPDYLLSTLLLWKNSDHNLAKMRLNDLPSTLASGTARRWAGIRREKQLYCLPTCVVKTEQNVWEALISCWEVHESYFKFCNAVHVMGEGKASGAATFPKAPECKKQVSWKRRGRGRETKTWGDRHELPNVWIAVGLEESSW